MRTIRAAAHGYARHFLTNGSVRNTSIFNQVFVFRARNNVCKIAVLIFDGNCQYLRVKLVIDVGHGIAHHLFALLDLFLIVVTNNIICLRILAITLHAFKIEKSIIAFGILRPILRWKQLMKPHKSLGGIDHNAFGGTRMNREPHCLDMCLSRIERLVTKFPQRPSVNGVPVCGTKCIKVEKGRAMANLLVRNKRNCKTRVRKLRVFTQTVQKTDNHCHAGLIVTTKQRGSITCYKVKTYHVLKLWIGFGAYGYFSPIAIRSNTKHSALISNNTWMNLGSKRLPCGIQMTTKTKGWKVFRTGTCGPVSRNVCMCINHDIFGAKLFQVFGNYLRHGVLRWR